MAQITLNSTGVASSGAIVLQTNGTTAAVTIDAAQNVAVGIASGYRSPTGFKTVTISGSSGGAVDLYSGSTLVGGIGSTGTATYLSSIISTPLIFATADTERMRLDSSGNLCLGTTSQSGNAKVTITTAASNAAITVNATSSGNTGYAFGTGNYGFIDFNSGAGTGYVRISAINDGGSYSNPIVFGHNTNAVYGSSTFTERARIDSAGALLVGQTSQSQTTVGFSATQSGVVSSALAASTSAANSYHLYSTGAGAYRFYVGLGGTINATNTSITGISDVRLKENIRDLDDGLDVVIALKPRKFDWKEGKGANTKNARGFIAQEFEQVLPDMIEEWLDPAPEGEEPYKAVNANLIPTLVKAIQELNTKFEAYKASHP